MRVLGFNAAKRELRYCVLGGEQKTPTVIKTERLSYADNISTRELVIWFKNNFDSVISEVQPDEVVYRLTWKVVRQEQVLFLHFPFAMLEYVCAEKNVPLIGLGNQAITAKRLGFPKGIKPIEHCDIALGSHPPHWDNHQRNAALAALAVLP